MRPEPIPVPLASYIPARRAAHGRTADINR